jgi:hypothetical protein
VIVGGANGSGIKVFDTNADDQEYMHTELNEHHDSVTCIAASVKIMKKLEGNKTTDKFYRKMVDLRQVEKMVSSHSINLITHLRKCFLEVQLLFVISVFIQTDQN